MLSDQISITGLTTISLEQEPKHDIFKENRTQEKEYNLFPNINRLSKSNFEANL